MSRKLTAKAVKELLSTPGRHSLGGNLLLYVDPDLRAYWTVRFTVRALDLESDEIVSRRRDLSLGRATPEEPVAQVRRRADAILVYWRSVIHVIRRDGLDLPGESEIPRIHRAWYAAFPAHGRRFGSKAKSRPSWEPMILTHEWAEPRALQELGDHSPRFPVTQTRKAIAGSFAATEDSESGQDVSGASAPAPAPLAEEDVSTCKTLTEALEDYLAVKGSEFKNDAQIHQWRQSLRDHVFPALGETPVDRITLDDVHGVLEPIWSEKTETATRIRGRIERIIGREYTLNQIEKANPARWKGGLENLLPRASRIQSSQNHAALSLERTIELIHEVLLADLDRLMFSSSHRALLWIIISATRSGESREARFDQIDLSNAAWAIPEENRKLQKGDSRGKHRVPLMPAHEHLVALSRKFWELKFGETPPADGLLFPGPQSRAPLTDVSVTKVLRKNGFPSEEASVHGFRSTFRDWVAEKTEYPNELAEMALAHTIKDKAEAAYRRGDMLDRRREMMREWTEVLGIGKGLIVD